MRHPIRWIFGAIVAGSLTGAWLGPGAAALGDWGALVIRLLKALATPLVFFAIIDALLQVKIPARKGAKLLAISALNAAVAGLIALGVAHLFPATRWLDTAKFRVALGAAPKIAATGGSLLDGLKDLIPKTVLEPFFADRLLSVVLMAILIGAALRSLRSRSRGASVIERGVGECFAALQVLLGWIVRVVPFAVFCATAKAVGTTGLSTFAVLGGFVALVTGGLVLHGVVYYSILLATIARISPLRFYRAGAEPLATAFSTGSSLATLPVTLRTLEKMGVSTASARLAACVGTNLNHDGILLYEASAALFVAQVFGLSLGWPAQVHLLAVSALAAVGIAGVPDAGLITLSLVLGAVGLPLEAVPLLMTVDWLVGRMRATVNVTSDMVVAHLLDTRFGRGVRSKDA